MTRTRVDCQISSEDRCEAVCWRRAGKANVSDMAAQLDHADSDGLLRDRPCTAMLLCAFRSTHVLRRAEGDVRRVHIWVNGRPRHGGTRWVESDLERQAWSWTTSRCVEVKQRGSSPRGEGVATRNSVRHSLRRRVKQQVTLSAKEECQGIRRGHCAGQQQ